MIRPVTLSHEPIDTVITGHFYYKVQSVISHLLVRHFPSKFPQVNMFSDGNIMGAFENNPATQILVGLSTNIHTIECVLKPTKGSQRWETIENM